MLNDFRFKKAAIIFLLQILIDGVYGYYVRAASGGRPVAAATSGAAIHLLVVFSTISYVKNWLYIFPLAAGSWVGTYLITKFDRRL